MTNEEWNKIQESVYLKLFSNTDGVSSKKIIKALKRRRGVWQKFYKMIGKEIDPMNERFSVMDLDKIIMAEKVYLVLRIGLWEFIVIDINNMRCLSHDESMVLLDHDKFEKFRGIDETDVEYFSFESLSNKKVKEVVDFYCEEEQILSDVNSLTYKFYHADHVLGSFTLRYDKTDSMVSVNDFNEGRCNYIFLDKNLKVYGASNLTGNKEFVSKLFDGSRDIIIPAQLLGSIGDDVISQSLEDKSIEYKLKG